MKKILLLLLFITGIAQAQIINFPDANFKAKLLQADISNTIAYGGGGYMKIDANSDGEIQIAEAIVVDSLDVSSSFISDLDGILSFNNLKKIDCSVNAITSLDVTSFSGLNELNCMENTIATLNVVGLNNLKYLFCGSNQLNVLDLTGLNSLERLICWGNSISLLNTTGLINLKMLYCQSNQLTTLNVSNSAMLELLSCEVNNLTSLNVVGLSNLIYLDFNTNQISGISLTGLSNLEDLRCYSNQITTLDLSGLINLKSLMCNNNQLTSLNFSGLLNLQGVTCYDNQLTSLDFSGNPLFEDLTCSNNDLYFINIKNGFSHINTDNFWSNNPNLAFVCVDDNETTIIQDIIAQSSLTNVNLNSYCTFVPGGNYNTITGTILFDGDNNGCDASDASQPFVKVKINDGVNEGAAFTNGISNYAFYTQAGNFTVTPDIENPTFFMFSSANAVVNFPVVDNSVSIQNFCMTANGVHPDVEIVIAPISGARPGFDSDYKIVYKNKGNQLLSGNVVFDFNDAVLDLVSSTPMPDVQTTGQYTFNYTNLLPFENREILITFNVNSPVETPAVNSGDVLDFTVTVTPMVGDETVSDNVFQYHQTVVNACDPNEKQCVEGNVVSPSEIGNYLHYIINFENVGTAEAENIVVKDVINTAMFDEKTLQVMNSSHPVEAKITGNIAEFVFKNIRLPVGGHGNILLKIKTKSNLISGDVVSNLADIFFDYNAPIETNTASTVFQSLRTNDYAIDQSVSIYPNPSKGNVFVKANGNIKSVQLFDVQGRVLETRVKNEQEFNIDISKYTNGVYFLKVLTDVGIKTEKLIKN